MAHLGPQCQAQQQRERVERRQHLSKHIVDPLWPPDPGYRGPAEQRQGHEIAQHAVGVVDGHVPTRRDGPRDFFTGEEQLQRGLEEAKGGEVGPGLGVEGRGPGRGDALQAGLGGPGVEESRGGVELGDGEPAGVESFFFFFDVSGKKKKKDLHDDDLSSVRSISLCIFSLPLSRFQHTDPPPLQIQPILTSRSRKQGST